MQTIKPPKLPKPLPSGDITQLENKGEYTEFGITGCDFTAHIASDLLFEQVYLRHVIFTQTHLTRLRLVDTRAEICDFSGANWENPRLRRVEFIGCRLLGMQMIEAQLENVVFKECKLDGFVFTSAICKAVRFEKCILHEALLEESDLNGVVFKECDLTHASLLGSSLNDVDLRGSVINGIKAYAKDMRGAIIEPSQAIQVVSLMGVRVQDAENSLLDR
jgi:uncharacterized protein YjbI with pentapeptide repeats